jgi:hypothetical protein
LSRTKVPIPGSSATHTISEHLAYGRATRGDDYGAMRYLAAIAGTLTTLVLILPH